MQGGRHGRGGRSGRQRRRRSRQTVRLLDPVLLLLLRSGNSHGYSLMDDLVQFGLEDIAPSVVYRALRDMEDQGWVQSDWDHEQTQGPPRRIYRLSSRGQEMLDFWMEDLKRAQGQIHELLKAYHRPEMDD